MKGDQLVNNEEKKSRKLPYVNPPEGWDFSDSGGPGPFVTKATFKSPEGRFISWNSRYHRKHHFSLDRSFGSTWWAPGAIGWWIGILFGIGSVFFAIGAVPGYASMVGTFNDGLTFFMGSLFFTSAAFLQYLETANSPQDIVSNVKEKLKILTWEPGRIDWWSTVVQFVGTLFFNLSTFASMGINMPVSQMDMLVWTPDVYGSICFLVASFFAYLEVSHAIWSWKTGSLPWRISIWNFAGSVAFGVSAVSAFVLSNGLYQNMVLMNLGTFVGAVCFFVGAILLLPERTHEIRINKTPLKFMAY